MGLRHAPVWILFLLNFFMALAMAYFTNHGEIYLGALGAPDTTIGFYFSVAALGSIIGPYMMAPLKRHFEVYKILGGSAGLSALALVLFNLTLDTPLAQYNMLAYMLFNSIFLVTANLFLTAHVDDKSRGFIISIYGAFAFIAWAIAPYMAPWAKDTLPGITIFAVLMAGAGLLIYITKFGLKLEQAAQALAGEGDEEEPKGKALLLLPVSLFAALPIVGLSNLFIGFWEEGITDTLMLFGESNHVPIAQRDLWVSAFCWGVFIMPFLGKITDKIGPLASYLWLNSLFAIFSLWAFFIPLNGLLGTVFFAVFSTYLAWIEILYLAYLGNKYSHRALTNRVAGAEVLISLGAVLGPWVFGKALTCFGNTGYMALIALPTIAIFVVAFVSFVKSKKRPI